MFFDKIFVEDTHGAHPLKDHVEITRYDLFL